MASGYSTQNGMPAPKDPIAITSGPPASRLSFDFSGKNFIVTGGTQGLGLEIARQLKLAGASKLALMARTRSKGEPVATELSCDGCTATFVETDMADPKSLESSASVAIEALGGHVHGLVCAAGITDRGNLMNTTVEMFDKQFHVNTRAPFFLTQAVSKSMIEKDIRGSIVHISSIAAKGGAPFITAYSASKCALNILAQNNAAELAQYGIRVNTINMGWTATENEAVLQAKNGGPDWLSKADSGAPLKRIMRPVDVACTVCFDRSGL
jgi:NAD(P)-dependent dehydrogenase (short-subunit alcohol dehydrogenase family)